MSELKQKVTLTMEIERTGFEEDETGSSDIKVVFRVGSDPDYPYQLGTILKGALLGLSGYVECQAKKRGLPLEKAHSLLKEAIADIFSEAIQEDKTVYEVGPEDTGMLN